MTTLRILLLGGLIASAISTASPGWADTATAKTAGKQTGSKYILGGDISSIVKQTGKVKDVYYKITLQLTDIESAVIEWADEVEIRKDSVRRLFGS